SDLIVLECKPDPEFDLEMGHAAAFDVTAHVLHLEPADVPKRGIGAGDSGPHRVVKTDGRGSRQLDDLVDSVLRHGPPPEAAAQRCAPRTTQWRGTNESCLSVARMWVEAAEGG